MGVRLKARCPMRKGKSVRLIHYCIFCGRALRGLSPRIQECGYCEKDAKQMSWRQYRQWLEENSGGN